MTALQEYKNKLVRKIHGLRVMKW